MSLQNGNGTSLYCHFGILGDLWIRTSGAFQLEIEGENPRLFCRGCKKAIVLFCFVLFLGVGGGGGL